MLKGAQSLSILVALRLLRLAILKLCCNPYPFGPSGQYWPSYPQVYAHPLHAPTWPTC